METTPTQTAQLPQQNVFSTDYTHQDGQAHTITFNSVFDSGNLRQVLCPSNGTYILHTAPDCCGTPYEGTQKSWFHFGVKGVPVNATLNFTIKRIWILASLYKSAPESYKPVCKIGETGWKRIEGKAVIMEDPTEKSLDVKFSHTFSTPDEEVFFAFTYPFSYKENQDLLKQLDVYSKDTDLYYHREVIVHSPQDRAIDLVTISSHEGKLNELESPLDENLFPSNEGRAVKFRLNKPVILITARVHPGETPASHTMNGILKFLLDKRDVRAQYLRNYFVFMLMPMINPDGVANGHYRMDVYNQNLNRYYKNPDLKKQPSNYAIKKLIEYLHSENRLLFFCDLHAHAAKKGCFLYGNALDFVNQVESILFTKIMGLNCVNFEDSSCNFSEKHMKARDKGEKLSKEGAARVCVFRDCNLIHSYTMECGLHFSNELNRIAMPSGNKEWHEDEVSDINSSMYNKDSPTYYSIEIYQNLGKAMLVSLLDTFEKNPCTRLLPGTLENLRREIAARICKIPRFWKEAGIKKKCIKINEIIKEIFYDELHKKNVFSMTLNLETTNRFFSVKKSATLMIQTPNVARSYKRSIGSLNSRQRDLRASLTIECSSVDENVEQEQELESEPQTLPKLRTAVVSREFRIKQVTEMKVPQLDKFQREENMTNPIEKKNSLQSTMRPSDRGVLVNSELINGRDIYSPNRTNLMIKDGKIQPFVQQTPSESAKSVKKAPLQISKAFEKKKALMAMKLPDLLESGTTEAQNTKDPFFLIIGGRNYMVSQPKGKTATTTTNMKSSSRKVK